MEKIQIAVIGAGLAGIATCWHLLCRGDCAVTLFDKEGVAGGASGAAAGLLHIYMGPKAKPAALGQEGMTATKELLAVAEGILGTPVTKPGIFRPATTSLQDSAFQRSASLYGDIQWWSKETSQDAIPGLSCAPGLWIPGGLTVDIARYLQGLWQACEQKGGTLRQEEISSLAPLSSFDRVVIAAGHDSTGFPELRALPLTPIKGQAVMLAWPKELPPLPCSLVSRKYLTMSPDGSSCVAAATYERDYTAPDPTPETAIPQILEEVAIFYPPIREMVVIGVRAGIRASTPDHMPLLIPVDTKTWVLAGLGSRGLLYHAYFAKILSEKMY